jgi:hypothetical protein
VILVYKKGFVVLEFFFLGGFVVVVAVVFFGRACVERAVAIMNELLQKSFAKGMSYVDLKKSNLQDVEMGQEMGNVDAEKNLAHFFEEVEQIKGEMERVKELLVKLQDTNDECKTVHRAQTMKTLRDRMDKDIALVNRTTSSYSLS